MLNLEENIRNLNELSKNLKLLADIDSAADLICDSLQKNKPLLIFGNGGSAADAMHMSGELVGNFFIEREPLNVICLNTNTVVMSAWSNDYNYETVFARQVEAHGLDGGICIGFSTSGNASSVVKGLIHAKKIKMQTIGFTGNSGGKLKNIVDILINVPASSTPKIQELHLPIYHYICQKVEASFKNEN